jgi:hypothetical protein
VSPNSTGNVAHSGMMNAFGLNRTISQLRHQSQPAWRSSNRPSRCALLSLVAVPDSLSPDLDRVEDQIQLLVHAVQETHSVGPQAQEGTTVNDALSAVGDAAESWFALSDAIETQIDELEERSGEEVVHELQACRSALMLLNLEVAKECERARTLEVIAAGTEDGESTPMAQIASWNDPRSDETFNSNLWEVATGEPNLIALLYVGTDDLDGGAPAPDPDDGTLGPTLGSDSGADSERFGTETRNPAAAGGGVYA